MSFQVDFAPPPTSQVASSYLSKFGGGHSRPSEDVMYGATQFLTVNSQPDQHPVSSEIIAMSPPPARQSSRSTPLFATQITKTRQEKPAFSNVVQIANAQPAPEINKISQSRIRLLALKYTNDSISTEMIARLEILNSRLLEHAPRVSTDQIAALEGSIELIKSIESARLARSARLGIKL